MAEARMRRTASTGRCQRVQGPFRLVPRVADCVFLALGSFEPRRRVSK